MVLIAFFSRYHPGTTSKTCNRETYYRECLTVVVDPSLSGGHELYRIAEMRGYPCMVVSDNGIELTSNAIMKWQAESNVDWHYIAQGKPMQNARVES